MFWVIYVTMTIKMSSCVARMRAWRCLLHWSVPSSITLSYTATHVSIRNCMPQIIHVLCFFFW